MPVETAMPKKRNDVSVKLDAAVYRMVQTVAAWREVSVVEYLTEIVEPAVRRHLEKLNQEIAGELKKPSRKDATGEKE